ncbi:MAG TPA: N-acetylneuraminate synthase family protein, partial [Tepidisphaeraceae bacterium]|nr:N-acetylneuraminate synthase family protein [Tepidisphaeraceae bacterium]
MNAFAIEDRIIAPGNSVFIIAEIGVNHDGSLQRAIELVEAARNAGADAVKLQIFQADALVNPSARLADYQRDRVAENNPVQMLRRYELPALDLANIVHAIRNAGMLPLATPFSVTDVEAIAALGLSAVKIASPDVVNYPLLQAAAKLEKPVIVSTGAATMQELLQTTMWLDDWDVDYALLHCVSSYPTPAESAHLSWIGQLVDAFDVPVGYSDHTTEIACGAIAVAAGACIVEKHLTYDRDAAGPDHSASSSPEEFAEYVRLIRQAQALCGSGCKHVLPIEEEVRSVSRQSIVAARDLADGHIIQEADLIVQRPGTGIPASKIPQIIGRRTKRKISAGT